MEAYQEAKQLMFLRTLVIAATIAFTSLCVLGFSALVWLGALSRF